jgi:hypothetical protein
MYVTKFKIIKFYLIKLASTFKWQPSYGMTGWNMPVGKKDCLAFKFFPLENINLSNQGKIYCCQCKFLINKSCKTYPGPNMPPSSRNWQLINPNSIFLSKNISSIYLFSASLYRFECVLCKSVLLHLPPKGTKIRVQLLLPVACTINVCSRNLWS